MGEPAETSQFNFPVEKSPSQRWRTKDIIQRWKSLQLYFKQCSVKWFAGEGGKGSWLSLARLWQRQQRVLLESFAATLLGTSRASPLEHWVTAEEPALNTGIKMSPQGKKWVLHLLMQLHTESTDLWQPGRRKALWQGEPGALWLWPWHWELRRFWYPDCSSFKPFFFPMSWALSFKFLAVPLWQVECECFIEHSSGW